MSIINRLYKIISSFITTIILLLAFAISSGVATFIENDYSTQTARASVYNTTWFELIMVLLIVNLIINIIKFKMYRKEKLIVFMFHASFVIILIGAGITRYIGYEGVMPIKEGKSANFIISQDAYLIANVKQINSDNEKNINKKALLSEISDNYFKEEFLIKDIPIKIEYVNFVSKANFRIAKIDNGKPIIEMALAVNDSSRTILLKEGESINVGGDIISFNPNINGYINFYRKNDNLFIKGKDGISTLKMSDKTTNDLIKNKLHKFERKMLYKIGAFSIVLKSFNKSAQVVLSSSGNKKSRNEDALIIKTTINNKTHESILFGKQGLVSAFETNFQIDNINVSLNYGSKVIMLPFSIHLKDFILDRYAGSNTPSSYKSEIRLVDEEMGIDKESSIFMNNILEHRGYRFYQASYEPDESGTILSANKDYLGTLVTYFGYSLLIVGLILTIFVPNSRFRILYKKLNNKNLSILFALLLSFTITQENAYAQTNFKQEIQKLKSIDENHARKFGKLSIQSADGRMKPINTLSSQIIRKVSGKNSLTDIYPNLDISPDQIFLGMLVFPDTWQNIKIIKIASKAMKDELGFSEKTKYASFSDFFDYKAIEPYKLAHSIEIASKTKASRRTLFDKEAIKLDEKVNILYMVYSGMALRIFPYPNRKDKDGINQTWYSPVEAIKEFPPTDSDFVRRILAKYFSDIASSVDEGNWSDADQSLGFIKTYQEKISNLTLSENKTNIEVLYNDLLIFDKLKVFYFFIGLFLFALVLFNIFSTKNTPETFTKIQALMQNSLLKILPNRQIKLDYILIAKNLIIIGFMVHTAGLIVRWYLSGHAPWSNGYESVIYVSWAIILAGLVLSRRSFLALSASAIMSSATLFVAHLSWLDPVITNLVPVLKSYWLTIHVSVITASYGFFALGFILGVINMILIIFKRQSNATRTIPAIKDLTIINEMSLYLGLILLTIGNFLGGIWANESWGRYWGWDAKETWALVSILIYAVVAHLRFIPFLKSSFTFNVASILSFFSIIMTYFGVNFYLAGLHSYAKGDPIPIPDFVHYSVYSLFALILIAYIKEKTERRK